MQERIIRLLPLFLLLLGGSCFFQNDPLGPNRLPVIVSYYPDSTNMSRLAPDSIVLSIKATDPDRDELDYRFMMGDSVLSVGDTVLFYARSAGLYHVQGKACDASGCTLRDWFIYVGEKHNEPPVIIWRNPEEENVSCAVGDTLRFSFGVDDDNPETVKYLFYLVFGGESKNVSSGSPSIVNRFMERGDYLLKGIAFDGVFRDTTEWNISVTGFPDTICPSSITDLRGWTGEDPGEIVLAWTATGDDGDEGRANSYKLRTSTEPIVTEEDWIEASPKSGEPKPSLPGSYETMVVRNQNLNPGTYLYATMRASDDFANLSPIGNSVYILVRGVDAEGYVIDLCSGIGVGGMIVSAEGIVDTTTPSGFYRLENLPLYTKYLRARDETIIGTIGEYYDGYHPVSDIHWHFSLTLYIMPVLGLVDVVPPDCYEGSFYMFFKEITNTHGMSGIPTTFYNWNHCPITVYNPPREHSGVDLQLAARGAMDEWESMTGKDLFVEVEDEEAADVRIVYDDLIDWPHHVVTTARNPDGTPAKRDILIYTSYTGVSFEKKSHLIYTHEFGHILGLWHSRNHGHIMLGMTMPEVDHVTTDEANLIKILYNAPYIFDYVLIKEE